MWKTTGIAVLAAALLVTGCSNDGRDQAAANPISQSSTNAPTATGTPTPTGPQLPPALDKSLAGVTPPESIGAYTRSELPGYPLGDQYASYGTPQTRTVREMLDLSLYQSLDRRPVELSGVYLYGAVPADALVQGNVLCLRDVTASTIPIHTCIVQFRDGWVTMKSGGVTVEELAAITQEYTDSLPS